MLAIENLNAHYGPSHVLQGVELEVPDGTIAAVLGRNGVGKTTTVRAIMGLVLPSSGRVLLDGEDIARWPPHRVARAGVAYVPEGRLIFPDLTVIENIRVAERRPAKAWPLERLLELFPALRERAGNKGSQLSGRRAADAGDRSGAGQRSKGAAARRAEPGPGAAGRARAGARHSSLSQDGVTILLIEQNLKLAEEVADRLAVMVKGRIVYSATPAAFRAEEASIRTRYLTV